MIRSAKTSAVVLPALLLGCLLTLIYWPALTGRFVNYDDPLYITENPVILQGLSWHSLQWSLTSISVGHWHPLTWLTHLAGIELFGTNPFGHHLINLLLHYGNALLLAVILCKMTGNIRRSWLVAVLFAVHPLCVETVAWVAERKGVLAAFFWLLAVHAYLRYTRQPRWSRFLPVLVFYVLGLSSKATTVTLPFVLLLLDFWPLNRWRLPPAAAAGSAGALPYRLLLEKLPLLCVGMISGAAAIYAMWHGGAATHYPLLLRLQNVLKGYAGYIVNFFHPVGLTVSYPFVTRLSVWYSLAACAALLAVTLFVILKMKRQPYLFTGWFWYLVTLAPVIGFMNLNLGQQTMPDRYAYMPLAGLLVMVVWTGAELLDRFHVPSPVRTVAAGSALVVLGLLAHRQAACWHDSEALFGHALRINPYSTLAHNNLGSALLERGELDAALGEFRRALQMDQANADAWNNLGVTYGKLRRNSDAVEAYLLALAADPRHASAHLNLGLAYIAQHDRPNALKEYQTLRGLHPAFAERLLQSLN